jgi:hypothetical protein
MENDRRGEGQPWAESGNTRWAADYLDLAPSTLSKMRIFGTGPAFFRLGRAVRYRREDLEEWRNGFRATSTTEADATLPRSLTTNPSGAE